ncbi:hypothetical protein [Streptomonospora salina]|uniref:OAA-family lectin sugar binding domain-containing protein n=1 Tax=Streptomonospora salina TaxID=104205 RepID=A0A841EGG2_9ACTN|nr:hypothetical protein [Streptomonospora salina]MBB5998511.1 hypothetical protein [Streptomonospora salina]
MEPTFADFSVDEPHLGNAAVQYRRCTFRQNHLALDAGGDVALSFTADADADEDDDGCADIGEVTLKVTALVSKAGPSPGHAPMTVLVNGEPITSHLTVPGGGDLPQTCVFAVPGRWLRRSTNRLEVRSSLESRTELWLYRITLDPVYERGRSERAMAAAAAEQSVLRYTTRRKGSDADWEPQSTGSLVIHVDRGERSLPAQISWRSADGSESAVSFQSAMEDFHGYHRDPHGGLTEYRGRLSERWALQDGVGSAALHRFRTEEGWGGGWHRSGELRLLVDDSGTPVERITWRDQQGNSGSVAFEPGAGGFLGYYQRHNEGPIGYRGTAIADPQRAAQ